MRRFTVTSPTGGVAIPAAQNDKTVIVGTTGTNMGLDIDEWRLTFDGITNSDTPIEVRGQICTVSAGTPSAITPQPKQRLASGETIQSTWNQYSAEPTYASVKGLHCDAIHPQQGNGEAYAFGRDVQLSPAQSFSLIVKPGANNHTLNARYYAECRE